MAIPRDRILLVGGDARNVPRRITAVKILGQRIGVVECHYSGQEVGEVVGKLNSQPSTLRLLKAKFELLRFGSIELIPTCR